MTAPARIHGTLVAIRGRGVLLVGRSGSGKSDLALRLIDRGAVLVSDDYVELLVAAGEVVGAAPATIAGQIEVRGIGIVPLPFAPPTPIALVVRLDRAPERLPDATTEEVAGLPLPAIAVAPFEASAPIKVELALARLVEGAP